MSCQRIGGAEWIPDAREATVSFKEDVVFRSELDQVFVLMVVVRVEEDLPEVSTRASALVRRRVPGLWRG